ncbi:MAG: LptF/LptG family permease [Gemmatimonadota bacterium]|jgi:lipopolysaccharide export system permease protein|nr:LptF/LptG family permease [Gemmatimonadota bacterium]
MIRILDRLIAGTFLRIFAVFVVGAPLLFIVGDIVEYVDRYFERGLTVGDLAIAYVYALPEFISWSFPIAALIATVFTIHSMTQHREVLAAKAGGISFHRLMAPLIALGLLLTGAGLLLSEVVPVAKRRSGQILRGEEIGRQWRNDFVFKTDDARTLTVRRLNIVPPTLTRVALEVPAGSAGEAPQYLQAVQAQFDSVRGWTFVDGHLRILPDRAASLTLNFDSLRSSTFGEPPEGLLGRPEEVGEMTNSEIDRMVTNLTRSGGDVSALLVEKGQRKAIAAATLVIILFGGPLATSSRRGGRAYGIGVALASVILYLLMFRLAGAAGQSGAIEPVLSAWVPNLVFLTCGLVLFKRVRT